MSAWPPTSLIVAALRYKARRAEPSFAYLLREAALRLETCSDPERTAGELGSTLETRVAAALSGIRYLAGRLRGAFLGN